MRRAVCFAIDASVRGRQGERRERERKKAQKLLRLAAPSFVFALVAVEHRKKKKIKGKRKGKGKARGEARHFIAAQFLKLLHTREFKSVYERRIDREGERKRGGK